MTLVAAFRCSKGGILLCADREENDGFTKRSVDKIYRIHDTNLHTCDIFIAGTGPTDLVIDACVEIHRFVLVALNQGKDVLADHREIIESAISSVYGRHADSLNSDPIGLIVVVAPYASGSLPLLYKSWSTALVPVLDYISGGSGQPIADYFATRLYDRDRLDKQTLAVLAAFILSRLLKKAKIRLLTRAVPMRLLVF